MIKKVNIAHHIYQAAAEVVSLLTHLPFMVGPHSPDMVASHALVTAGGVRVVRHSVTNHVRAWHNLETFTEKFTRPFYGSMPWLNLVFGETVALFIQGFAQTADASNAESFTIGVASALLVELLATIPAARRYSQKQSKEKVLNASLIGFWLGGAMGAGHEKLPPRQALFPIGAYMLYGTALAGLAEYNNLAAQLIKHANIVMPILLIWGLLKKTDELFEHKGATERISDRTVELARQLRRRK